MADVVVNNPTPTATQNDNGIGFLLGVLLLLAVVFFLIWYGLPRIVAPQVSVPRSVNVNVTAPK